MMAELLSIQVAVPTAHSYAQPDDGVGREWTSAIFKQPVSGPVWLGSLNLDGDQQADLKNHGGPDKAVLMYAAAHYEYWRAILPDKNWAYGGFGENFTASGLDEFEVSIGDVFAIGEARVQVSQPRQPCWKLARRWEQKDLAVAVRETSYTGWYARVLQEGLVGAGIPLERLERPYPQWTIARVSNIINDFDGHLEEALELAQCPAFSSVAWRRRLEANLKFKLANRA
jgi:MOSC domain-containing protein YiiM